MGKSNQDQRVTLMGRGIEIRRTGKPVESTGLQGGAVYLVIDCSGSMAGDKMAEARKGAVDFSGEVLAKRYAIGMISFASEAKHICEPRQEISNVQRNLPCLEAGGSTNMASAIKLATVKLTGRPVPLAMVVITDGMPDHEEKALDAARDAKERGIDIITVGTDDADRAFSKNWRRGRTWWWWSRANNWAKESHQPLECCPEGRSHPRDHPGGYLREHTRNPNNLEPALIYKEV